MNYLTNRFSLLGFRFKISRKKRGWKKLEVLVDSLNDS